jgi:16S rRNA (cytosine1402-N4)-methyltransferase
MENYHQPVMLSESIEGLNIRPEGTYIDLTFGGGGHSRAILGKLGENGKLYSFDQDEDVLPIADSMQDSHFQFIEANFRFFKRYLRVYGVEKVDGILADLGVSSHQFDTASRGFSTRFQGLLDMRMNQQGTLTAQRIVNEYKEEELHRILGIYGEVTNAKTLANALVRNRLKAKIETIDDLKRICTPLAPKGKMNQYLAQVFQALRIEVNDEMKALEDMLEQTAEMLNLGGRLVILSYHSLEDRLVKNFIQKGKFQGDVEKDIFGNFYVPFQSVHRKPLTPSSTEIAENPRARSAKLRVAVRV